MMGCLCKAETADLGGVDNELETVRWFSRDELRGMLERSAVPWTAAAPDAGPAAAPTRTAPPIAIAHKLVRVWVDGATP